MDNFTNNCIKIINLERRTDRKKKMIDLLTNLHFVENEYEFIKAVDGITLKSTTEIYQLFKIFYYKLTVGVVGCALSHYYLWKQLIDSNKEYYVIFEDDILKTCANLKQKI